MDNVAETIVKQLPLLSHEIKSRILEIILDDIRSVIKPIKAIDSQLNDRIPPRKKEAPLLSGNYCLSKDNGSMYVDAYVYVEPNGRTTIKKGSKIALNIMHSCTKSTKLFRKTSIACGRLLEKYADGKGYYEVTEDFVVDSPSGAGCIILARSCQPRVEFKPMFNKL